MKSSCIISLGSIAALTLLTACGDGDQGVAPPPGPVPASISVASGNNQSSTINRTLPLPLVVTVTSSTGAPVPDMRIDWTTDGGFLTSTSERTDTNGQASTTLQLGRFPVSHTVVATVRGLGLEARFQEIAHAPIILHYDGTSWSVALEDTFGGFVALTSVDGVASNKALAGGAGCRETQILSYDGAAWGGTCTSTGPIVRSIAGTAPNDVFAIEGIGRPLGYNNYISHYDGQAWNVVYNHKPCQLCNDPEIVAVAARAGNDVIAVGEAGTMARFDGTAWTRPQSGTTKNLRGVWLDGASTASFVVGDEGTILYSNGNGWQVQPSGTTQRLSGVWGTSASNVFAVGAGGVILHYDGATWTAQNSGTTNDLVGVWGDSSGSIFAVGLASTILHYDGTSWSAQPVNASINLSAVWGTSGTNVFAVGAPR